MFVHLFWLTYLTEGFVEHEISEERNLSTHNRIQGISFTNCSQLLILCVFKGPIHDQKTCQYIEAKNWHWIFDRVWEIFFLSKNTLTQNINGSNLFDIFWPVVNILTLTRVWAPVKILIKNSVLRWTFSQNQSYGNSSILIKHFQHNEFW